MRSKAPFSPADGFYLVAHVLVLFFLLGLGLGGPAQYLFVFKMDLRIHFVSIWGF